MFYVIQKRDTKAFCQRKIGFEKFCKKHFGALRRQGFKAQKLKLWTKV